MGELFGNRLEFITEPAEFPTRCFHFFTKQRNVLFLKYTTASKPRQKTGLIREGLKIYILYYILFSRYACKRK